MTDSNVKDPVLRIGWTRVLAVVVSLLFLVTVLAGSGVANHADNSASMFLVDLDEDGSATVSLRVAFDLATAEEREAFETLQNDGTAKEEFRQRFNNRMQRVSSAAADRTGRDMSVSDASISLETADDGETGFATVSVRWTNLATREGGQLVVTEPFASGFTPQYRFVFVAPEGYRIADVSNSPDFVDETHAVWPAGTSLEGFQASVASPTEDGTTATGGQPGFGLGLASIAIAAMVLLGIRRSGGEGVRTTGR